MLKTHFAAEVERMVKVTPAYNERFEPNQIESIVQAARGKRKQGSGGKRGEESRNLRKVLFFFATAEKERHFFAGNTLTGPDEDSAK